MHKNKNQPTDEKTLPGEGATTETVDFVDLRALKIKELSDAALSSVTGGIRVWADCTCGT